MSLKIFTASSIAALIIGSGFAQADAPDALDGPIEILEPAEDSYVNSGGEAVRTGLNECLRLGGWSEDGQQDACEGIEAKVAMPEPEPEPEPAPVAKEPVVRTATLGAEALFDTEKSTLTAASEQALADLLVQLEKFDEISDIEIVGHTDSRGEEDYNQTLSVARAESVKAFLAAAYPNVNITSRGMGETAPVATNSTPEGRQLNRRVEVSVSAKDVSDT